MYDIVFAQLTQSPKVKTKGTWADTKSHGPPPNQLLTPPME